MNILCAFLLMFGMCSTLCADMGPQGFHAYWNQYFVETGSFKGNGIQKALDAGFSEIHSLEIDESWFNYCQDRFSHDTRVHMWLKDSGKELWSVIESIDEPITFWLDGHNSFPAPNGGKNTPLLEELEQIAMHPIKTHTILIDDMHCCDTNLFDYMSRDYIVKKVLEINPDYTVYFVPGGGRGEYPTNVLVAKVPG